MNKQIINTENAPQAIGTYSQAVCVGNIVYFSGQIPLDPATCQMVSGDFKQHARQVFNNLKAVAEAAGGSLAQIVKLNIFLLTMDHYPDLNETMQQYFQAPYPARAAVAVSQLPNDAQIEIEAIMVL